MKKPTITRDLKCLCLGRDNMLYQPVPFLCHWRKCLYKQQDHKAIALVKITSQPTALYQQIINMQNTSAHDHNQYKTADTKMITTLWQISSGLFLISGIGKIKIDPPSQTDSNHQNMYTISHPVVIRLQLEGLGLSACCRHHNAHTYSPSQITVILHSK